MPIRINLKEIFSSDPQEILVDKLNFNYNKLLELGVGSPGPIGLTGPQGPAGPVGLLGPQGDRGATWWVDSGDPNTLTFTGLIDGDLYLDQTSNVFQVWKYDDGTSIWTQVVSIAAIVNAYLTSLSSVPFETVTTTQNPGSTAVNKFILFDKRDNSLVDTTRGAANTSLNNILFLNNFDEADLLYPTLGQSQYNSLLSIVPAHEDTQLSGKAQTGRYHLELGSLYMDNDVIPIGTIKYSDLKHNLKVKFYKQYIDPILPPYLPATNSWINTARFSLSYTESQSILDIDQNGAFEFLFPKWNNEGMSPIREELSVVLASADAIVERSPAHTHIVADGIHVSTTNSSINATLGLALDYSSLNAKLSGKNHLMLDSNSGVDGVILLNKGAFINGDANVVDGLAIGSGFEDLTAPANGLIVEGKVGIGIATPDANTTHHIYETGSAALKIVSLSQLDNLSFGSIGFLAVNATTINDLFSAHTPAVVLQSSAFSGTNKMSLFTGNNLQFTGTNTMSSFKGSSTSFTGTSTINGNFTGIDLDLTLATNISHNGNFYGNRIQLDSSSDFLGSSRQVFGNYFQLAPDLSSGSGGTIRGNQIEITDYLPNATTEIRGTQTTIEQPLANAQGITYGSVTSIQVNSTSSPSSDLVGQLINVNTTGLLHPNASYGSKITMGTARPAGGKTYGYHVVGATDNYAEGASRFNGSVSINDDNASTQYVKNVWHGLIRFGFNHNIHLGAYFIDLDTLPTGFSVSYASSGSSGGGPPYTRAQLALNHPSINVSTSSMQVQLREGGTYPGLTERFGVVSWVILGSTSSTILFTNVDALSWDTQTMICFNFTLTEFI